VNFFLDAPDNPLQRFQRGGGLHQGQLPFRAGGPRATVDIVVFLDSQSRAVHSAVYLADDLVFTKNGNNFAQTLEAYPAEKPAAPGTKLTARLQLFRVADEQFVGPPRKCWSSSWPLGFGCLFLFEKRLAKSSHHAAQAVVTLWIQSGKTLNKYV